MPPGVVSRLGLIGFVFLGSEGGSFSYTSITYKFTFIFGVSEIGFVYSDYEIIVFSVTLCYK